jgi:ubiquinone/menaquinone biosynthesis C-methylase UbiE
MRERQELSIRDYYERAPEATRHERGSFVLEKARTQELIRRFIPPPPATVLDVGGAAGVYAFWLADLGYDVHLVDLTPRLVAEAERLNVGRQPSLKSCKVGDARSLPFADASADVVLLLGPLYHLVEADDRNTALREAWRVLKPGGLLFGAAISRWASLLVAMTLDLLRDEPFASIVERDVHEGQHRNPTDEVMYFTTSYFHRPEELKAEVVAAGFELEGAFGIEGPGGFLPDISARVADPQRLQDLMQVARLLEREEALIGASDHYLAVAQKAG